MGAHHSQTRTCSKATKNGKPACDLRAKVISEHNTKFPKTSSRGKPGPPSQPQAIDVTHNSLTLVWQHPKVVNGNKVFANTIEMSTAKNKHWNVITKCCQGNRYQVKNLRSGTDYIFRVRAENIHGLSKPSRPSEAVQTSMFDTLQQTSYVTQPSEEKSRSASMRRQSFNLHLEGTVTCILSHTDVDVSSVKSDVSRDSRKTISGSQRDFAFRASWQPTRKRSLPVLLPGTKTNSLVKLRDSQTQPNITKLCSSSSEGLDSVCKESGSTTALKVSEGEDLCAGETQLDLSNIKRDDERKQSDTKASKEDNPWEHSESVTDVINDRIGSALLSDDVKMALYARSGSDVKPSGQNNLHAVTVENEDQTDFRTLRSLLRSEDMIVKPTRSLPDVSVHSQRAGSARNKLSTIVDTVEDEESVRITTL